MVQILTLEINLGPAEAFAQIGAEKDGIRTPGVVLEIVIQLVLEKGIVAKPVDSEAEREAEDVFMAVSSS